MAKYAICEQVLVPVRKQPSDQSEMTNQLVFGDFLKIIDSNTNWYLAITQHDGYEGWVDKKQIRVINQSVFNKCTDYNNSYCYDLTASATSTTGKTKNLLLGNKLPNYNNNTLNIANDTYQFSGNAFTPDTNITGDIILNIALKFKGAPYLWGGRSPFGIDCSGFTQLVFMMGGVQLYRDASQQVKKGIDVNFINEAIAGDLAFFDNQEGNITHVGIIINNKKIIHASGEVRIDNIDHQGIYNEEQRIYTHKLRIIKRLIVSLK